MTSKVLTLRIDENIPPSKLRPLPLPKSTKQDSSL